MTSVVESPSVLQIIGIRFCRHAIRATDSLLNVAGASSHRSFFHRWLEAPATGNANEQGSAVLKILLR